MEGVEVDVARGVVNGLEKQEVDQGRCLRTPLASNPSITRGNCSIGTTSEKIGSSRRVRKRSSSSTRPTSHSASAAERPCTTTESRPRDSSTVQRRPACCTETARTSSKGSSCGFSPGRERVPLGDHDPVRGEMHAGSSAAQQRRRSQGFRTWQLSSPRGRVSGFRTGKRSPQRPSGTKKPRNRSAWDGDWRRLHSLPHIPWRFVSRCLSPFRLPVS